jgi:hypothetical protein
MVGLHPYEYVSFNSLVGGTGGAQGRFELDYWGISLAEATRRLEDHLEDSHDLPRPGQPFKVYVCGNVWSAAEYFPSWLTAVERREDADFQIAISQHYCPHVPGSRRLLGVMRNGAALSFVEDLRPSRPAQPDRFDQAKNKKPLAPTRKSGSS